MDKAKLAADFLQMLAENPTELVSRLMDNEMDPSLVELFNQFGKKLEPGEMSNDSFKSSLLIIGYLVRAYEEGRLDQAPDPPRPLANLVH